MSASVRVGLVSLPPAGRAVRAIGFDDAPFVRRRGGRVPLAGVVCPGTRFEGLVLGAVRQDGRGATRSLDTASARR